MKYGKFKPTVFDNHIEIDYEPSNELIAARERCETAWYHYQDCDSEFETSHRNREERWRKELAVVEALERSESRENWLVLPCNRDRDSPPLVNAEFDAVIDRLGGESETVEIHSFGHWGHGWFEIGIAHPSREADIDALIADMEHGSILSDEEHSKIESEAMDEDWDNWGRRDFESDIMHEMERLVNGMEDTESPVEREVRELRDRYNRDSDGIPYDISGKPIPTPHETAWEIMQDVTNNWSSEQWDLLFYECEGERQYTGDESIFTYNKNMCALFALGLELT